MAATPQPGPPPDAPHDGRIRCPWATGPWLTPYHDTEWGVPVHDDRLHFELLTLEGAQAGLSWLTVLKRRAGYRQAFADFDPAVVARLSEREVESLLADPGIIRHRQKVESTVTNAVAFLRVQQDEGSFDAHIWRFVGNIPIDNRLAEAGTVPAATPLSHALSADLRRRGFRFVGPTACYAYLQAAGMVNDHLVGCFRHGETAGGK
jgi:DNA-3-methyladenine glycosylase I